MRASILPNKPPLGTGLAIGHPLTRGLIGRFLFNEGNGTRLNNLARGAGSSATSFNGAFLANMDPATDWISTDRGPALAFDGVNDYAQASFLDLDIEGKRGISPGGSLTISVWFRTSTAQTLKYIFMTARNTLLATGIYFSSPTQIGCDVQGDATGTLTSTQTYSDGRWHCAVQTYDGNATGADITHRLYYDGRLVASASSPETAVNTNDRIFYFGSALGTGNFATVDICDARVYSRALGADEVLELYGNPYADSHRRTVWGPDRSHAVLEVEALLSGDWRDLTPDLILAPDVKIEYGITGTGPTDLVASAGHMDFTLNNSATNSAGLVGYYSPGHANCRAGFDLGVPVRFRYLIADLGITYFKFSGWLDSIDPLAGQHGARETNCTAVDWMDEAARASATIPTQINQRADQVLAALVAAAPKPPYATNIDVADTTFTYAFDSSQSEAQPALTEFQRIAVSEYGRIVMRGDTQTGGVLRFIKRSALFTPTLLSSFDDSVLVDLSAPRSRGMLTNRIKATIHPRRVDSTPTSVLFTNQGTPSVEAGETVKIVGYYNDPANRSTRVGGFEMVQPSFVGGAYVAGTDYAFNRKDDGTGLDLTANLSVAAVYGANSVEYTLVNNGTIKGFVTKLQARGRGLYNYDPVDVLVTSPASILAYGEAPLNIDMMYQPSLNVARAVANYILTQQSTSTPNSTVLRVVSTEPWIESVGDPRVTLQRALLTEPGDVFTVSESVTGINYRYVVNHVSLSFETPYHLVSEFTLQRDSIQNYWALGVAGKSEVGVSTYVGPF